MEERKVEGTSQGNAREARVSLISPIKPERRNLYYCAISANLLFVCMGCSVAWTSPAIPLLRERGLKRNQETWVVSLLMLGSCLGPSVYSSCIDRFGRKKSLLITGVVYLLSWLLIGLSDNIYTLCVGRFIGGIAVGSTFNCVPVYISEISDVSMRQSLTSMAELFISIGCLIEYSVGPRLSYGNLVLVSVLPALVFGLATTKVAESPYHIVARGRTQEAFEVLVWLRGPCQTVSQELRQIEISIRESQSESGSRLDLIRQKGPRKAFLCSCLMMFVIPFAAVDVVTSYLQPILTDTSLSITPKIATMIVGSMQVLFGALEPFVVHKFGSKWTYVVCSFLCAFFLMVFGTYKYFDERHYDMSSLTAIPILSIVLFEMFFVLGVGTIPWSISAELFPPSLKGFAINLTTTMDWIVDFIVVTLFGDLSVIVGVSTCFLIFGSVLTIGTILTAIFVPNTKGLTLNSIHNSLQQP